MTRRPDPAEIDRRVEEARRLLRERRVIVDPDPGFAARVVARLPRGESWAFAWAARRVLPATLAVAVALTIAIFVVDKTAGEPAAPAAVSRATTPQHAGDPLDWLLENRTELQ